MAFALIFEVSLSITLLTMTVSTIRDWVVLSQSMREHWNRELAIRSCGAKAAARANLEDATKYLVSKYPDLEEKFATARDLELAKPEYFEAGCDKIELGSDYGLYREFNPELDIAVPNWIYVALLR